MKSIRKEEQLVAYFKDDAFCKLLNQLMEDQNVSAKRLSEGLCSESMLSKIKQGKRIPRKMVRDRLLARLGLSDERCENLLDYEEYVKWTARRDIVKAVMRKEIVKARKHLTQYARSEDFAGEIGQQFYHAMEIQLMLYESATVEEIGKRLELAAKLTIPSIGESKICDLQLDLQEINLLLEYEKYNHPECFAERCEEILQYIEKSAMDERSIAKIYPKVAWYLCEQLSKEGMGAYQKIIKVTNRAVEYLRNTQKKHYLWEILSAREDTLKNWIEQLGAEGKEKRVEALLTMYRENVEWKNAIETAYKMVNHPLYTDNFCYLYMQQEIYCIKDVMRCRREMLGISRSQLNAGTFDDKTLIRLETENRKPRQDTIKTLFARLNLSGELQRVDVVTSSKEAWDLLEQLVKYANNFELEKERETLRELVKYLNMDIPLNRQFVKAQQAILLHGGDKANRENAFELMKEALECTISLEKIQKSETRYLTGGEVDCLLNMAVYTGNLELNEYHEILLELCSEYENEDTVEEYIGRYTWIMTLIARVYSNMGLHKQAIALSERVMRASLECGRLVFIEQNVNCISWNRTQLQKKDTSGSARCDRKKGLEMCIVLSRFCKEVHREKKYFRKVQELDDEN